jgi:hypothetical protein
VLFQGGFTFTNFLADAFAIFMFVLWFWLLVIVSSDLFRRTDISGLGKVLRVTNIRGPPRVVTLMFPSIT